LLAVLLENGFNVGPCCNLACTKVEVVIDQIISDSFYDMRCIIKVENLSTVMDEPWLSASDAKLGYAPLEI
jgi:hypothetical protein